MLSGRRLGCLGLPSGLFGAKVRLWKPFLPKIEACVARSCGCGSKNRYQHGSLVSGNMDQNLRNPSCLIFCRTHVKSCCTDPDPSLSRFQTRGQEARAGVLVSDLSVLLQRDGLKLWIWVGQTESCLVPWMDEIRFAPPNNKLLE